ncbi:hypothetical protein BU17DRAFT_93549 [Hysterangium stoloniferum]|nr:hypothetical protein BU17DRAFT_93549 [Hysterangium stoloniferum]
MPYYTGSPTVQTPTPEPASERTSSTPSLTFSSSLPSTASTLATPFAPPTYYHALSPSQGGCVVPGRMTPSLSSLPRQRLVNSRGSLKLTPNAVFTTSPTIICYNLASDPKSVALQNYCQKPFPFSEPATYPSTCFLQILCSRTGSTITINRAYAITCFDLLNALHAHFAQIIPIDTTRVGSEVQKARATRTRYVPDDHFRMIDFLGGHTAFHSLISGDSSGVIWSLQTA